MGIGSPSPERRRNGAADRALSILANHALGEESPSDTALRLVRDAAAYVGNDQGCIGCARTNVTLFRRGACRSCYRKLRGVANLPKTPNDVARSAQLLRRARARIRRMSGTNALLVGRLLEWSAKLASRQSKPGGAGLQNDDAIALGVLAEWIAGLSVPARARLRRVLSAMLGIAVTP